MTDDGGERLDPRLPDNLAERLDSLDVAALHAVIDYAEDRIGEERHPIAEDVRAEAGDVVVRIDDYGGYALVEKRTPDRDADVTSLYLVRHEREMDGEWSLDWSFLRDLEGGAE